MLPQLTSHLRSGGGSTAKCRAVRQEREGCRGKRACAAQHTAWLRMTSTVRLLSGSFGIIPSAAFEFNTDFWLPNRKGRQNHEAAGRKKRDDSTSSREH